MDNQGTQEILFSDCFQVDKKTVEDYGAFNISLLADLPLFIDPFLLFNSTKPEYKALHDEIIKYLNFLRERSLRSHLRQGDLEAYYHFKEVKQTWLGFTLSGNRGSGLGPKFARALNENLVRLFAAAAEEITEGRHLEKLCLFGEGVGKDNISDFTTNLIKSYLLSYTETYAQKHLRPDQLRTKRVEKALFNYETESWQTVVYQLPFYHNDYVLLVPRDILTCDDTWINREELLNDFETLPKSISDIALRAEVNNYLLKMLPVKPKGKKPTKKERREAARKTIRQFPEVIDYFIKFKEENGDRAVSVSDERVSFAQALFLENFTRLAALLATNSDFYNYGANSLDDAIMRAKRLKDVVERRGGNRFFYDLAGAPVNREHDLRIAHRFCWLGVPNGMVKQPGQPIPVEFKLASNSNIEHFFSKQIEDQNKSQGAPNYVNIIFYFSEWERQNLAVTLRKLGIFGAENIIVIDASINSKDESISVKTLSEKVVTQRFDQGYALVIGVANYPEVSKLSGAVLTDARDVRDVLCSPNHCGYDDEHVRLLLDEQATAEGIRSGLSWLAASAGTQDTAMVFFSGHGGRMPVDRGAENYLIPYDTVSGKISETAISSSEVTQMLRGIKAQRMLVFFDSCYSGGTGEAKEDEVADKGFRWGFTDNYYEQLAQGTGRVIMAASRMDEPSYILPGMRNSLFTHFLLEALRGSVRSRGDGIIRVFDIFDYVSEKVPARFNAQHPIFKAADLENNFPVSLYMGGSKTATLDTPIKPQTGIDKMALRLAMIKAFSNAELEELCADVEQHMLRDGISLKLDLEDIGGDGKSNKILRLIEYIDRRQRLDYLIAAVQRARPGIV